MPAPEPALFVRCLQWKEQCRPDDYTHSYCNYIAQTMQPEMVQEFDCLLTQGCEAGVECHAPFDGQEHTLGPSFCERSAACGQPCAENKSDFLNSIEHGLRPEIQRGLRQCIAEKTCGEFKACAKEYEDLWQLAWEKADPGTPSACSESWLSECGTRECGFTCRQSCPTCTPRCATPCRTNDDCVGTTTGIHDTPHCNARANDAGYCEPE